MAGGDAPLVVHLINHNYNEKTDKLKHQKDIIISIRTEALGGRPLCNVVFLRPNKEPLDILFENNSQSIKLTVPELELRGMLKLEC